MMNEKAEHLRKRIADRQANQSTASQYGYSEMMELSDEAVDVLKRLPVCAECNGKKEIKPMFYWLECPRCYGTGLDLSNPLAVIRLQQEFLATAKTVIIEQRRTLYMNSSTEGERNADSVEGLYIGSQFNKYD